MKMTVADWISRYEENQEEAVLELINFLFRSAGYASNVTDSAMDATEMKKMLEKISTDKTKRLGGYYPILSRGKGMSKFKANFLDFWDKLILKCEREILYDEVMIQTVLSWTIAIASTSLRPLRHTATLAALQIMKSIITVCNSLKKEYSNTAKQLKTEQKRVAASNKRSSGKLKQLEAKYEDMQEKISELEELMELIFKGVFYHRYRDTFPEIRAASIAALGDWIIGYPIKFLSDHYLKYVGWLLSDKEAEVRQSTLEVLKKIYSTETALSNLDTFTERFKARMVACTLDVSPAVSIIATEVVTLLAKHQYLEEEEIEHVYRLMSDTNVRIRFAAATFVKENLLDGPITSAVTGKKRVAERQLRSLVEFVVKHCVQSQIPNYVVDALWATSPFLKKWDIMSALLENSTDLSEKEQVVLARVINVCVKKACGHSICPKDVRAPDSKAKESEAKKNATSMTEFFAKALPQLLSKYQSEALKVEELVELPQYFDLEVYRTHHLEKYFKDLLGQLKEIFMMHTTTEIFTNVANTFQYFLSVQHSLQEAAEVAFAQLTDDISSKFYDALPTDEMLPDLSNEKDETTQALTLSLDRIHEMYLVNNLRRLDIDGPLEKLLRAHMSGTYQNDKIACLLMRILFQALLWRFATINPDEATRRDVGEVTHQRDELTDILEKYLKDGEVFSHAVRAKAYELLCDLVLVFKPGMPGMLGNFSYTFETDALPKALLSYFEQELSSSPSNIVGLEEEEEAKPTKSKNARGTGRGKRKGKGKKSDDESEDEIEEFPTESTKKKEQNITAADELRRPEVQKKLAAIRPLTKAVVYNAIPRHMIAHEVLKHYNFHGLKCKEVFGHFLMELRGENDDHPHPAWRVILDAIIRKYEDFLARSAEAEEETDDLELEQHRKDQQDKAHQEFVSLALSLSHTYGIKNLKRRAQLIMLLQEGIKYALQSPPKRFAFLTALHPFITKLAHKLSSEHILRNMHTEARAAFLDAGYELDESDDACKPYLEFMAALERMASLPSSAMAASRAQESVAGTPVASTAKRVAKRRKTPQSKYPPLELTALETPTRRRPEREEEQEEQEEPEGEEEAEPEKEKEKEKEKEAEEQEEVDSEEETQL
ncbi:Cohesin subunit SA-2 [Balamuthia mandrillaris]